MKCTKATTYTLTLNEDEKNDLIDAFRRLTIYESKDSMPYKIINHFIEKLLYPHKN